MPSYFKLTCGSGVEDENVKTLQTNGHTDAWTDGWAKAPREKERKSEGEREQKWSTLDSKESHTEKSKKKWLKQPEEVYAIVQIQRNTKR